MNPYTSPTSDLSTRGKLNKYKQNGILSFSERIGRLRYIADVLSVALENSFVDSEMDEVPIFTDIIDGLHVVVLIFFLIYSV